jgi:hypothetical protein
VTWCSCASRGKHYRHSASLLAILRNAVSIVVFIVTSWFPRQESVAALGHRLSGCFVGPRAMTPIVGVRALS